MASNEKSMNQEKLLSKKDLTKIWVRSLPLEVAWHYERQQHLGFVYSIMPALKKIYKDQPEKYKDALSRHTGEFYNTSPQAHTFIAGIVASMEEENAKTNNFDVSSISAMKAALIGPAAGIFDPIFLSTIRVIAVAVGTSLCFQGNWLGVLLYVLIYNIPAFICRIAGVKIGYTTGASFISHLEETGLMEKFRYAASLVAMMAFGAMTNEYVFLEFATKIGATEESAVTMQSILDGILPGATGLGIVWLFWWLINKKKVGIIPLLTLTIILSILGVYLGIFTA